MGNSFTLLLLLGAAATAFFLVLKRPILYLFGASDDTFPYADDYMTIYQEGRDRYIVSDIYSLKFIEFYDTRCRDICDEVLRSGWMPNQGM